MSDTLLAALSARAYTRPTVTDGEYSHEDCTPDVELVSTPAACPRCGKPTSIAMCVGNREFRYPVYCECEPVDFGWRCPGCSRVWAPGVKECWVCNG